MEPAEAESAAADNAIDNAAAEAQEEPGTAKTRPPIWNLRRRPRRDNAAEVGAGLLAIVATTSRTELERVDAHNGGWLHPGCVDAFLRARMAEEGAPWDPPNRPARAPPPPPAGGPKSNGAPGEPCPARRRSHLHEPPTAAGMAAIRTVRTPPRRLGQPSRRTSTGMPPGGCTCAWTAKCMSRDENGKRKKSFPTAYWHAGDWVWGWPKEVVPYRLPELLAAPPDALMLIREGEKDADKGAAARLRRHHQSRRRRQVAAELAQ